MFSLSVILFGISSLLSFYGVWSLSIKNEKATRKHFIVLYLAASVMFLGILNIVRELIF